MGAMDLNASSGQTHQMPNGSPAPIAPLRDDQGGKLKKDKDKKKKHLHIFR
jgi:hypothetical protein